MILRAAALAAALVAAPGPAAAHGGLPGTDGFLAGLLHPLATVEHLVLLLGLGFLSGQVPRGRRGAGFAAVGLGLTAGLALANLGAAPPSPLVAIAVLGLGCATGGLVALAHPRLSLALVPSLAGLGGLAIGLDTGGQAATALAPAAGVMMASYLVVLDAAALSSAAARPPFSVAVRAGGSWIVAVTLVVLTLSLVRAGPPA